MTNAREEEMGGRLESGASRREGKGRSAGEGEVGKGRARRGGWKREGQQRNVFDPCLFI